MSKENNGGRAFPVDSVVERDDKGHLHGFEISSAGMTLRDYFAASALQGLCANEQCRPFSFSCDSDGAANIAYKMADAMLARRNK